MTDGSTPGFNFWGSANPYLQFFTGYRWKKAGAFFRFIMAGPEGQWFNLALGVVPTYQKTADAVNCFALMVTVRVVLTATVEVQLRVGARDPAALALHVKGIMDGLQEAGKNPVITDTTQGKTLEAAIEALANKPPEKKKLN